MADINELNAPGEDLGGMEINYDAPEPGSFPPAIEPGTHEGIFTLDAEEPFGTVKVEGKDYLQVTHGAKIIVDGEEKAVNFMRASWYKSPKMAKAGMNSAAAELTRSLGIKIEGALTPEKWKLAMQQADGRMRFTADYGWELYCRNCQETTVSTSPNKKKGQQPWPRTADAKPIPSVGCPKCKGTPSFGNVRIVRYKLPATMGTTVTATSPAVGVGVGATVASDDIPF